MADVFIIHADVDTRWVKGSLVELLLPLEVQLQGTPKLGRFTSETLAKGIGAARVVAVVLSGAEVADAWSRYASAVAIQAALARDVRVQPVLRDGASGVASGLPEALTAVEFARLTHEFLASEAQTPVAIACPYPGLREISNPAAWTGYEAERDEVVARIQHDTRVVLVIGQSGIGKSSLLQAGVCPRLEAKGRSTALVDLAKCAPQDLVAALAGWSEQPDGVLVIDAMEQLCDDSETSALQLQAIHDSLAARTDARLILALRWEFLPALEQTCLAEHLMDEHVVLWRLGPEQLGDAIRKPARAAGVWIDDALVEALKGQMRDQPGALAALQELLVRLWERRERRFLGLAALGADESVATVLGAHGNRVLKRLGTDETLAIQILVRLVHTGDGLRAVRRTRTMSELSEIFGETDVKRCVKALSDGRLVTVFRHPNADTEAVVTLSHERLIVAWPRLRQEVERSRAALARLDTLQTRAQQWADGKGSPLGLAEARRLRRFIATDAATRVRVPGVVSAWARASLLRGVTRLAALGVMAALVVIALPAALIKAFADADARAEADRLAAAQVDEQFISGAEAALRDGLPSVAVSLLAERPVDGSKRWVELGNEGMQEPMDTWLLAGEEIVRVSEASGHFVTLADGELRLRHESQPFEYMVVGESAMSRFSTRLSAVNVHPGDMVVNGGFAVGRHSRPDAEFSGSGGILVVPATTRGGVTRAYALTAGRPYAAVRELTISNQCYAATRLADAVRLYSADGDDCCVDVTDAGEEINCVGVRNGTYLGHGRYVDSIGGVRKVVDNTIASEVESNEVKRTLGEAFYRRTYPVAGGGAVVCCNLSWLADEDLDIHRAQSTGIDMHDVLPAYDGWLAMDSYNKISWHSRRLKRAIRLVQVSGSDPEQDIWSVEWNGGYFLQLVGGRSLFWRSPGIGLPASEWPFSRGMWVPLGKRQVVEHGVSGVLWRGPFSDEALAGSLSTAICPPGVVRRWDDTAVRLESRNPRIQGYEVSESAMRPLGHLCRHGTDGASTVSQAVSVAEPAFSWSAALHRAKRSMVHWEMEGVPDTLLIRNASGAEWSFDPLCRQLVHCARVAAEEPTGSVMTLGGNGLERFTVGGRETIGWLGIASNTLLYSTVLPTQSGRFGIVPSFSTGSRWFQVFESDGTPLSGLIPATNSSVRTDSTGRFWTYRRGTEASVFDAKTARSSAVPLRSIGAGTVAVLGFRAVAISGDADSAAFALSESILAGPWTGDFLDLIRLPTELRGDVELEFLSDTHLISRSDGIVRQWWLDTPTLHAAMLDARPPCVPAELRMKYLSETEDQARPKWEACIEDWEPS